EPVRGAPQVGGRHIEGAPGFLVGLQQGAHPPPEVGLARAGLFDERGPVRGGRPVQGGEEDGLDVIGVVAHGGVLRERSLPSMRNRVANPPTNPSGAPLFFSRSRPRRLFSVGREARRGRKPSSDRRWWGRCRGPRRPGGWSGPRSSAV